MSTILGNSSLYFQVYGTTPNDFLVSAVAQLQELGKPSAIRVSGQERQWGIGKVFSVGEGEGRNACFLASLAGSEGDAEYAHTLFGPFQ